MTPAQLSLPSQRVGPIITTLTAMEKHPGVPDYQCLCWWLLASNSVYWPAPPSCKSACTFTERGRHRPSQRSTFACVCIIVVTEIPQGWFPRFRRKDYRLKERCIVSEEEPEVNGTVLTNLWKACLMQFTVMTSWTASILSLLATSAKTYRTMC